MIYSLNNPRHITSRKSSFSLIQRICLYFKKLTRLVRAMLTIVKLSPNSLRSRLNYFK